MFVEGGTNNPLSIHAVVAWLEQRPANENYIYIRASVCLAAQYNASIGRKYKTPNLIKMLLHEWGWRKTFDTLLEDIAVGTPRTFGAALQRARALL